jgi:hypothetical protein
LQLSILCNKRAGERSREKKVGVAAGDGPPPLAIGFLGIIYMYKMGLKKA